MLDMNLKRSLNFLVIFSQFNLINCINILYSFSLFIQFKYFIV